jgi:prepilin-type N-terminal cleavage/methylation domain-containing protein
MLRNDIKRKEGFTIIEVLIVLAIAGLILLIVFLAVPALQRNSRNTAIKNDVQNVVGGVGEFQGANNGSLPTAVSTGTSGDGVVTYSRSGGNQTTIKIQGTTSVQSSQNAPASSTPEQGTVRLSLGYKCDGTRSPRAVSAVFTIETSSGSVRQCQES